MFRRTDSQKTLGSLDVLLSPKMIDRLERHHWAGVFRRKALPVLLSGEETFAPLFCADNGRPNKPVAATLGVLILKEMFDLTDEVALDNFEFNNAWQYALDVDPDQAHICQKTLHNFRAKMSAAEEDGILTYSILFDQIVRAIIADLGLKLGKQRLDSTHIRSNMAVLTRLQLFTHQITAFLKKLHKQHPGLFKALPAGIHQRYIEREGYFADAPSSKGRRRLEQCAADLWRLVDRFRSHRSVSGMPSFLRIMRILEDQCIVEDHHPTDPDGDGPEGVPVHPKDPKVEKIPATSLQGSDEDATYGHKGKGYQAQVAETCEADNAVQVVTHVSMEGAHRSDQHSTIPVVDELNEKDRKPDVLLADTNYGRGQNIVDAADRGITLMTPSCGREPKRKEGQVLLDDFEFTADGQRLVRCPAGHEPIEQGGCGQEPGEQAPGDEASSEPGRRGQESSERRPEGPRNERRFARIAIDHCAGCDRLERCPTKWHERDEYVTLTWTPAAGATSARRRHEKTKAFKDAYRIRSGIEATNSEFKRRYGGGRLRVRGSPAVRRVVHFKFMALNVGRWIAAAPKTAKSAA